MLARNWSEKWLQEGREEGREEGKIEGKFEGEVLLLTKLLTKKFGSLPAWVNEKLSKASTEELEYWGERVLDGPERLEDIFQ